MTRRLLAMLIALVGTAGVVVVGLTELFPVEDRAILAQPGPIRTVAVDVEVGRVDVVAGQGDEARITRARRYLRGAPAVREELIGGVLRIEAECQRIFVLGCSVYYRLEVPAGVSVNVRTERGSVSVAGITGMVEVDAGAGSVRLTGTRGPVRVETSAGRVEGVDIAAEFLDATTGAGSIRLSFTDPSGRIGLKTGAGNIDLTLPAVPGGYRVAADAGAGDVQVTVDQNPGGNRAVTATTGGGNIRIRPR